VDPFLLPSLSNGHIRSRYLTKIFLNAPIENLLIEILKRTSQGNGNQKIAPRIPDSMFDLALFMPLTGSAKMRLEEVVGAERDKGAHFLPWAASSSRSLENNLHCCSQIVVADPVGDAPKVPKGFYMPLKKAFLPLGRKSHCKRSPRKAQAHHKKLHFLTLASDIGVGFSPIHLSILAWFIFQWEEHVGRLSEVLPLANVLPDGRFTALVSFGGDDLKNPARGVALFTGKAFPFL
jgi:hypothetical protein